jgi:hypothetical protein
LTGGVDIGRVTVPTGSTMPDHPELQRVTTEYVAAEDRVRLSGETGDDQTLVVWLTQRMLNLIVSHMIRWLEDKGVADGVDNELLQNFAQQAAEAALEHQQPVRAEATAAAWRVDEVDITTGSGGVVLTFKSGDAQSARITMGADALRQWLGIVHGQYVNGAWSTHVWPAWMQDARAPSAKPDAVALH